ncbi:hypothetical protein NDU88_003535 [Pleurodeles waltl]|uniref:Uncharacterized protein n=1 Tax=Pleurodeles waltl TaxID=8319 RepID=A0AAV7M5L6_PLEWA|nr:hypothetical protein NDU88_003535 [Pleurodeles waltl]
MDLLRSRSNLGPMSLPFFMQKDVFALGRFLDEIEPSTAGKFYFRFRCIKILHHLVALEAGPDKQEDSDPDSEI